MADPCDDFYDEVGVLIDCTGTNGSTTFTDTSTNVLTITPTGDVLVTNPGGQFAGGCAEFGSALGAGALDAPITPGGPLDMPGDFTIEGWFYLNSMFGAFIREIADLGDFAGGPGIRLFTDDAGGPVRLFAQPGGTAGSGSWAQAGWANYDITRDAWHHFAVVRNGTNGDVYVDGVQAIGGGANNWVGTFAPSTKMRFGNAFTTPVVTPFAWFGRLQDIRITKGVARYTATFTPPAALFPALQCFTTVPAPDVVGMTVEDAESALVTVGLTLGTVTYDFSDTVPAGEIISQDPLAGVETPLGDPVDVVVSLGASTPVPDVIGLLQPDATAAIIDASLVLGTVGSEYNESFAPGLVSSQSPVAGTPVLPGSDVDIQISLGPFPVSVPNVVTYQLADAVAILASVGLVLGATSETHSDEIEAGAVVSQSPFAGSTVVTGAAVDLVLSIGPAAVVVPDVVGMTSSDAANTLAAAFLRLGRVTVDVSGTFPLGTIASQDANAGALVPSGTKINLVLSAIAPPFDVDATVISQYSQAPTLVELVENVAEYIDPRTNLTLFYSYVWNVDTAQGFGLDVWGRIVGIGRLLRITGDDPTFGFWNESVPDDWQPWSQGRFARGGEDGTAVILDDSAYRILILVKALANITATSSASINALLRNLFPGRGKAYVEDLGGMSMRFVFDFKLTPVEYAIVSQSGALPHPAGVSFSVVMPP
jgi:beta-lactam-binding protein with PASTA domain